MLESGTVRVVALLGCISFAAGAAQSSLPNDLATTRNSQEAEAGAEEELRTGIELTEQGRFAEAIPHLAAARGRVGNEFAAEFNLALCYAATGQNEAAIAILKGLASSGRATAGVYNLLAQALIGASRMEEASAAFERAVALDPKSEKLYLLVADACMDHESYDFGVKVASTGLKHLPKSARLHYERGILLSFLDQPDAARKDLRTASELAPGTTVGFLAEAQEGLLNADMAQAIRAARAGLRKGPDDYVLLTILGQALIRAGASPGQPEFAEARTALEKAVAERPDYSVALLALGQLELMSGQIDAAMSHLNKARELAPDNPAAYSQLAAAYRRSGDLEQAQKALVVLASLNRQQAAKYKLDPPEHKGSYIGAARQ